jgi:ankyrin repeat protein
VHGIPTDLERILKKYHQKDMDPKKLEELLIRALNYAISFRQIKNVELLLKNNTNPDDGIGVLISILLQGTQSEEERENSISILKLLLKFLPQNDESNDSLGNSLVRVCIVGSIDQLKEFYTLFTQANHFPNLKKCSSAVDDILKNSLSAERQEKAQQMLNFIEKKLSLSEQIVRRKPLQEQLKKETHKLPAELAERAKSEIEKQHQKDIMQKASAFKAIKENKLNDFQALVRSGFDINAPLTADGKTAYVLSAFYNQENFVKYLLTLPNIDPNPKDAEGKTLLERLKATGRNDAMVKIIEEHLAQSRAHL